MGDLVPGRLAQRLAQLRRPGREQADGLVHISPGGGGADAEPGGQFGERLALAQVDKHQQRLLARVQLPPGRPGLLAVTADHPGHVVQGRAGQRQRGAIEQHQEPLGRRSLLGRSPHLPGAPPRAKPTRRARSAQTRDHPKIKMKNVQCRHRPGDCCERSNCTVDVEAGCADRNRLGRAAPVGSHPKDIPGA